MLSKDVRSRCDGVWGVTTVQYSTCVCTRRMVDGGWWMVDGQWTTDLKLDFITSHRSRAAVICRLELQWMMPYFILHNAFSVWLQLQYVNLAL